MNDKDTTIQQLKDLTEKFRAERNWGKHHSPKNLAISIAVEAAELLEHFQWDSYKDNKNNQKEIEKELADIIIYCLFFASSSNVDVAKAVEEKLRHSSQKYPVHIFNKKRDDSKDYYKIKKEYRRKQ